MNDYKLVGKDVVKEMLGTCSDQMAYKIIRQLNAELEEMGVRTVQGKVSLQYLKERFFEVPKQADCPAGDEDLCQ